MPIVASKINLRLEIFSSDGTLLSDVPCYSVEMAYSVSGIPEAIVNLPMGISVSDGIFSTASMTGTANPNWQAKLYISLQGEEREGIPWPAGEFLIFEGFVHSVSVSTSARGSAITMKLRHWLTVLHDILIRSAPQLASSQDALSPGTLESSPAFYADNVQSEAVGRSDVGHSSRNVSDGGILQDLWACVIKPTIAGMYSSATVITPEGKTDLAGYLNRIHGECYGTISPADLDSFEVVLPSKYITSLTLRFYYFAGQGAAPGCVYGSPVLWILRALITREILAALTREGKFSAWDGLVALQKPFLFMIVPRPSDALVVPFNPIQGCPMKIIEPDEVITFRSTTDFTIRPPLDMYMISMATGSPVVVMENLGCDPSLQPELKVKAIGQRLLGVRGVPTWIEAGWRRFTEGEQMINLAAQMFLNNFNLYGYMCALPALISFTAARGSMEAMAMNYIYFSSALYNMKGRTAHVTTRLRFDIAPGTMVQVNAPDQPFVNADPNYRKENFSVIGFVRTVSYLIKAGQQSEASTSLQIEFVRNMGRKDDDKLVSWVHPIYIADWPGAPLVEGPW